MTGCSLCGSPVTTEMVDAGGDLGHVHRSCFRAFDADCETWERMAMFGVNVVPLFAQLGADSRRKARRVRP